MKLVTLCGFLAESLNKIENLKTLAEHTAPEPEEKPADSSGEEKSEAKPEDGVALAALEELHRYAGLAESIGNEVTPKERSEMLFLCSAAVRILASEVYEATVPFEDRTKAKRYNSEAMRTAKKAAALADRKGEQASEEVLFGINVINA